MTKAFYQRQFPNKVWRKTKFLCQSDPNRIGGTSRSTIHRYINSSVPKRIIARCIFQSNQCSQKLLRQFDNLPLSSNYLFSRSNTSFYRRPDTLTLWEQPWHDPRRVLLYISSGMDIILKTSCLKAYPEDFFVFFQLIFFFSVFFVRKLSSLRSHISSKTAKK